MEKKIVAFFFSGILCTYVSETSYVREQITVRDFVVVQENHVFATMHYYLQPLN